MIIRPRKDKIRLIVVHTNEGPEYDNSAEGLHNYITQPGFDAGYHKIRDNNSTVTCADDSMYVQGAPYVNEDGLHVCDIGYAAQTRAGWLDSYSRDVITGTATIVADWCKKHGLPPKRLTPQQVRNDEPGICGHIDVTNAYRYMDDRLDHWDPGPGYPWDIMLNLTRSKMGLKPANDDNDGFNYEEDQQMYVDFDRSPDLNKPAAVKVESESKIIILRGNAHLSDTDNGPRLPEEKAPDAVGGFRYVKMNPGKPVLGHFGFRSFQGFGVFRTDGSVRKYYFTG